MPGTTEWRPRDLEASLFAVKCLIAALLAFFVAARIGLSRPYWAVTTSFIVAQPLSGAVLSKALYRVSGTLLGGAAAVVLLPLLVNEPFALSAALGVWLGVCVYLALLDRTPRSYVFLLAGYTASIIAFPSVDTPGAIFVTAVERVQEIIIGILAGSLAHGALFPRTVTARLLQTLETTLVDARKRSKTALAGVSSGALQLEQTRLTSALAEIDQLTIHLPFDTARVVLSDRSGRLRYAMVGEVSIGGVYLPALLLLSLTALALTGCLVRLGALLGVYRFLAYRPLVDGAVFVLLLGLLTWLTRSLTSYP